MSSNEPGLVGFLLRLIQGISSGCNHATPTPQKSGMNFITGFVYDRLWMRCTMDISRFLLQLSQGISSGCHHALPTPQNLFWNCQYCGKGNFLLLRLSQGISSGCHPTPQNFFSGFVICVGKRVMVRRDPVFCFDLARVFLQGATMPSLHPRILFFMRLQCGKLRQPDGNMLRQLGYFFRVPPCHPYTLDFFNFWICQQCWKSVFCFDLSRVFIQDATPTPKKFIFQICRYCGKEIDIARGHYASASTQPGYFFRVPPLHPRFFPGFVIVVRGIMLLLRLSQGISSGCHHALPTPQLFWICQCGKEIDIARGIMLLLRLVQGLSSGCHPYALEFFQDQCGKEINIARRQFASTQLGYFFRVPPCPPYTHEKSKLFWIPRKRQLQSAQIYSPQGRNWGMVEKSTPPQKKRSKMCARVSCPLRILFGL